MVSRVAVLAALLLVGLAGPTVAGEMSLTIHDGRVTLIADNVPVRQILAEWARVGQTKIVNGERVPGPPLTVRLLDVPERDALEVLLRTASGFLAAPRATLVAQASQYDRILILPTSTPPPAAASPASRRPGGVAQPFVPPPPMPTDVEEPGEEEAPEAEDSPANMPASPFAPPRTPDFDPANPQQVLPRRGDGGVAQPVYPAPDQGVQTGPQTVVGAPTTATRPGVIVTPPVPTTAVPGTYPPRPTPQPPPQ
jgi:hypothetical protein